MINKCICSECGKIHLNPWIKIKVGGRLLRKSRLRKKRWKYERKLGIPQTGTVCLINWLVKHTTNDARWDCVSKAMQTLEHGFKNKIKDDAWYYLKKEMINKISKFNN